MNDLARPTTALACGIKRVARLGIPVGGRPQGRVPARPSGLAFAQLISEPLNGGFVSRLGMLAFCAGRDRSTRMKELPSDLAEAIRLHQLWVGRKVGGRRANFSIRSFDEVDLSNSNLQESRFVGCSFERANLAGANFDRSDLFGSKFNNVVNPRFNSSLFDF